MPWIRIGDLQWVNGDVAVHQWTATAKAAGLDIDFTEPIEETDL